MDELVRRLSTGDHAIVVGGAQPSLEEFRQRIEEIGYILVEFTDTQGGTVLGVNVDDAATVMDGVDFEHGCGLVHVEGTLTLNYVKVRCIADINLATLRGMGHVAVLDEVSA